MPPADRRAERRALLVEAAFDLLGTEGWGGTTVRAVCHAARLNPLDIWARLATGRAVPGKADAAAGVRYQWLEGDLRRACSRNTVSAR